MARYARQFLHVWWSGMIRPKTGATVARRANPVFPHVTGLGVEPGQQLMSHRGADHFWYLPGGAQPFVELGEVRFLAPHHIGDDEEDGPHPLASAAHRSLAFDLSAVMGDRGIADEFRC